MKRLTAARLIKAPESIMEVLAASGTGGTGVAIALPVAMTIAATSNPA